MAKGKPKAPPVPRGHFSRINYLYQASSLLATTPAVNLSNYYLSQAKAVARKCVLRIDPSIKRTICKKCDSLLFPGSTAQVMLENLSRGGKKPKADVLVVECLKCGMPKRFPVGKDRDYTLWTEKSVQAAVEDPAEGAAKMAKPSKKQPAKIDKQKSQGSTEVDGVHKEVNDRGPMQGAIS